MPPASHSYRPPNRPVPVSAFNFMSSSLSISLSVLFYVLLPRTAADDNSCTPPGWPGWFSYPIILRFCFTLAKGVSGGVAKPPWRFNEPRGGRERRSGRTHTSASSPLGVRFSAMHQLIRHVPQWRGADLQNFNPSLLSLPHRQQLRRQAKRRNGRPKASPEIIPNLDKRTVDTRTKSRSESFSAETVELCRIPCLDGVVMHVSALSPTKTERQWYKRSVHKSYLNACRVR